MREGGKWGGRLLALSTCALYSSPAKTAKGPMMPNEFQPERRQFSRVTFDGRTRISQGARYWDATLVDLSLKGLLIETPGGWDDADTSQPFTAHISLLDDTAIVMSLNWRHSESNQGRTGFECAHIDIDSITHLRRLVELNLGDPDLLERELATLGQ